MIATMLQLANGGYIVSRLALGLWAKNIPQLRHESRIEAIVEPAGDIRLVKKAELV